MKKKVLFVATTAKGHLNVFHIPYIQMFKRKGWQVDSVTNGDEEVPYVDNDYLVPIERRPFRIGNLKAICQLCKIMKERKYDLVLCHTPMGGVVARVSARLSGIAPVIYMAHGFHFYKGAALPRVLLYKSVERFLAHWTDGLIVINQEDLEAARKFKFRKNGQFFFLDGIGVDIGDIRRTEIDRERKRAELGISKDAFVVLNIGEMIARKNQMAAIAAIAQCKSKDTVLLICGRGEKERELKRLAEEMNLGARVVFAGFRRDINEVLKLSDVFLFPSFQEGLPISMIEAMAAGLPIVCSDIRGNRDLVDENGGFLCSPDDVQGMSEDIDLLYRDRELGKKMGDYNYKKAGKYDVGKIMVDVQCICERVLQCSL